MNPNYPAVIFPTVHNNGTSQTELIRQISETNTALNNALEKLCLMQPNARDYYIQDNNRDFPVYPMARQRHDERINAILKVQKEIMEIGEAIADQ